MSATGAGDCDWNPEANRGALVGEPGHPAELAVTQGQGWGREVWHLCERCAALPRFKGLKRKSLKNPHKENA